MTDHSRNAATSAGDPSSAQPALPPGFPVVPPPSAHGYYTFVPYSTANPGPATQGATALPQPVAPAPAAGAPVVAQIPNPHIVTGIPPGLASLLRWTGPWSANIIYSVPPSGPLAAVDEGALPAPEWYCITRGRFVGVIDQYAQAHWAIRGVSNAAHKAYITQAHALDQFNKCVGWGGVEVV